MTGWIILDNHCFAHRIRAVSTAVPKAVPRRIVEAQRELAAPACAGVHSGGSSSGALILRVAMNLTHTPDTCSNANITL